ncbi:uncharacterized protein JCM6883_006924 [Sporobolomyces salmoneus]|uniref:uncharacterized protein n=1 Tax=Sporobolomyces salmoneus TaxID=183962 RepID=UPI00317D36D8
MAVSARPSYATTHGGDESHYASAQSYLQDTTQEEEDQESNESMWTAPSSSHHQRFYQDERPSSFTNGHGESSVEILSTPARRPPLTANLSSSISTNSNDSLSSGSEVDLSGPLSSPFFVPPPPARSTRTPRRDNKENRNSLLAPTPRPNSPLPPLPPAKSTARHLRGPSNTTTTMSNAPFRAPPLTEHNSLAAFQAAHRHVIDSIPTTSEDSHRTSSDVDLDISFDYDARKDTFSDERSGSPSSGSSKGISSSEEESGKGSLEKLEREVMKGGWVGIEMSKGPQEHGIPEGQLVRSGSGKLVGARASKARSALDLRAQFKAAELERQQQEMLSTREEQVSIVVMEESIDREEWRRRNEIRAGKRPVEGERAGVDHRMTLETQVRAQRRRSAGFGFAYNKTESLHAPPPLRQPPHSAPLASEPVFANQQQQKPAHQVVDLSPFSAELDQAKRTKAFPLPLRLNPKRSSLTAATTNSPSPKLAGHTFHTAGSRQSLIYYDSDVASSEPSPLFDEHSDDEGGGGTGRAMTNRTAPSTPNDTPLFQECFSDEETTPPPPLPHKDREESLAGLGFDFDISETSPSLSSQTRDREEFPVVPLRRRSLPPVAPSPPTVTTRRRMSNRHMPIPSLSISPPTRTAMNDLPLEDILETDSSRSSQDSSVDPTVSPSRRISRRLSSSNPGLAGIGTGVVNRRQSFTNPQINQTSTPTNDRGGATIITPQHLLVTPSASDSSKPRGLSSSPSFSFSPAPLRLVKAQLLRAAGYRYDHVPTASPPLDSSPSLDSRESIQHATSSPRKIPATPQPPRLNEKPQATVIPQARGGRVKRRNRVGTTLEELSDLLSSSAETWIDEVIPAKLAFIAGFLLGPWCWIIGGWYLRPQDGELPQSRGTRCRTATCNCGRILRGSTSRQQAQHTTTSRKGEKGVSRERGEDDWAGLDKWVFGNRVAACGGGVGIAVLVGVAIWAAASS